MTIPPEEVGPDLWLRLASARQDDDPDDAFAIYVRLADEALVTADRRSYAVAVRILRRARTAADAAAIPHAFAANMARLRDVHRRRPALIAMLDKAGMP